MVVDGASGRLSAAIRSLSLSLQRGVRACSYETLQAICWLTMEPEGPHFVGGLLSIMCDCECLLALGCQLPHPSAFSTLTLRLAVGPMTRESQNVMEKIGGPLQ